MSGRSVGWAKARRAPCLTGVLYRMPIDAWARFALPILIAGTQGVPRELCWLSLRQARLLRGEIESAAGSRAETVMREKIGYCRQQAAECAARAQEAADKDTRELFLKFRNSWLNAAKRYESSTTVTPDESPERRPPPLSPPLTARARRRRPHAAPPAARPE